MKPSRTPIKSPDYSSLAKGKPLTDRVIKQYILLGKYGKELQERELAKENRKKKPSERRTIPKIPLNKFLD